MRNFQICSWNYFICESIKLLDVTIQVFWNHIAFFHFLTLINNHFLQDDDFFLSDLALKLADIKSLYFFLFVCLCLIETERSFSLINTRKRISRNFVRLIKIYEQIGCRVVLTYAIPGNGKEPTITYYYKLYIIYQQLYIYLYK